MPSTLAQGEGTPSAAQCSVRPAGEAIGRTSFTCRLTRGLPPSYVHLCSVGAPIALVNAFRFLCRLERVDPGHISKLRWNIRKRAPVRQANIALTNLPAVVVEKF